MNNAPTPDFERILADNGMPVTEKQIRTEFNTIVADEGLITNTSRMSPFWRLITAIVTAPVLWLKTVLVNVVMPNTFLATASGVFIDLFAWAVNLERKEATALIGQLRFTKYDATREVIIPAGTLVQTERINGNIYQVAVQSDTTLPAGTNSGLVAVDATEAGSGHNLAPGYFRILPVAIEGVASVQSEEDWIVTPGADIESDDDLRDRVKNQFNLVGQYHIDAVYRGMIAGIAGLTTDRIFFEHDAPRGPGTANVYLLLDSGIASQPFIDLVNHYVMAEGNHGHGDDVLCLPLPETRHNLDVTLYLYAASLNTMGDEQREQLRQNAINLIRCAFRENTDFEVQKTWPFSRFSMSRLGEELHNHFPDIESVIFSSGDILSGLDVPRLSALGVEFDQ